MYFTPFFLRRSIQTFLSANMVSRAAMKPKRARNPEEIANAQHMVKIPNHRHMTTKAIHPSIQPGSSGWKEDWSYLERTNEKFCGSVVKGFDLCAEDGSLLANESILSDSSRRFVILYALCLHTHRGGYKLFRLIVNPYIMRIFQIIYKTLRKINSNWSRPSSSQSRIAWPVKENAAAPSGSSLDQESHSWHYERLPRISSRSWPSQSLAHSVYPTRHGLSQARDLWYPSVRPLVQHPHLHCEAWLEACSKLASHWFRHHVSLGRRFGWLSIHRYSFPWQQPHHRLYRVMERCNHQDPWHIPYQSRTVDLVVGGRCQARVHASGFHEGALQYSGREHMATSLLTVWRQHCDLLAFSTVPSKRVWKSTGQQRGECWSLQETWNCHFDCTGLTQCSGHPLYSWSQ